MSDDVNHPLRELVDEWRAKADILYYAHENGTLDCISEVSQIEILADELEEALDECNIGTINDE